MFKTTTGRAALAGLCMLTALAAGARDREDKAGDRDAVRIEPAAAVEAPTATVPPAPKELVTTELKPGKGAPVTAGAWVRVHYTGWLQDLNGADGKGQKFDSSLDHGEAFVFQLGRQKVIRGWDLGIAGMRPGSARRLVIPATLAYGARGAGSVIPPHATLVFEIQLIDFLPPLKDAPAAAAK